MSKAPEKPNPFGTGEVPEKFASFDVFTKVCPVHPPPRSSALTSAILDSYSATDDSMDSAEPREDPRKDGGRQRLGTNAMGK